jgi:hypothetical protein
VLIAQSIQISGPAGYDGEKSQFNQSSGTTQTTNMTLSSGQYSEKPGASASLRGGRLNVQNISIVQGCSFAHSGGQLNFSGVLTLDSGIWYEQTNDVRLGQLQLGAGTNSIIQFPPTNCLMRFADSSSLNWSNTGVLTIVDWNGSLAGGGTNVIGFGNSSNALTAQQLSQIQFANPVGLPAGNYLAKILSNGEVVPGDHSFLDGAPAPFFTGEASLGGDWFYLSQSNSMFGYYYMNSFPYVYHSDMGWEYFEDAADGHQGAYFYDFTDGVWFYTQPSFFPFLYDFNVNAWMYYEPLQGAAGHYTSNPRWFYNLSSKAWSNHL